MNLEKQWKERELVDSVMGSHNPLIRIEIGSKNEVIQVRKLAREIVAPMVLKPEITELTIEAIATVALHCMYAHYADPKHYPLQATLTTVANFFKISIYVEELEYDENGIKLIKTKKVMYQKSFKDTIRAICDFNHVPYEGVMLPDFRLGKPVYGLRKNFTMDDLHYLYSSDVDIYEINPCVHPWIYRNFMLFATSKSNCVKDALTLAPIAIEHYLDNHPEYTDIYINHAIREAQMLQYEPKNVFSTDDMIEIEPVHKGRKLKSLREIVRQVFKK